MYNKIFIFSVLTTPFLSAMQKTDEQPPYIDHNQPPISQCTHYSDYSDILTSDSDSIYSTRAANNDTSSNDSIHTYLVLSDDSQYSDDDEMPICMQCSNSTIPFNTRNNNNTRNNKKNTQYNKTKTGQSQTQTYDFDTDDYNSNNNFDGSRSGFRKNNNFDNSNNNFDGSRSRFRKNNDANNNFNNNDYNNMGLADLIRLSGIRGWPILVGLIIAHEYYPTTTKVVVAVLGIIGFIYITKKTKVRQWIEKAEKEINKYLNNILARHKQKQNTGN